ncbi:hypothetical protein [Aliifodinibius sp. S!AR15-10]|uniref:hypothetical protein n=1 Tax=Aliifodinibius sp. S!AR15-10 TaxID=2950437 RepID=UPI00287092C2|nr:hypothetical protein [Aliifodinibius sp. S!AR15-10]
MGGNWVMDPLDTERLRSSAAEPSFVETTEDSQRNGDGNGKDLFNLRRACWGTLQRAPT